MNKKISARKEYDIFSFREILTEDEMGKLSKIINDSKFYTNTMDELDDYIEVIKKDYCETHENILEMSLEKLEEKRKLKARLKNK